MLFTSKLKPHSCTIRGILPQEVHFTLLICSEMTILDWITSQRLSLAKTDPFFSLNSHWLPVTLHLEVWTYHSGMSTSVLIIQVFFFVSHIVEIHKYISFHNGYSEGERYWGTSDVPKKISRIITGQLSSGMGPLKSCWGMLRSLSLGRHVPSFLLSVSPCQLLTVPHLIFSCLPLVL